MRNAAPEPKKVVKSKRLPSADCLEVYITGTDEYGVKRRGTLLAIIEAASLKQAIVEAKKMFNKDVIAA